LLALLPRHELASGAMGSLRSQARPMGGALANADSRASVAEGWIDPVPDRLRTAAGAADQFDRAAGARATLAALAEGKADPGSGGEAESSAQGDPDGLDHGATGAASGSAPLDSAGPGALAAGGDGAGEPGGPAGEAAASVGGTAGAGGATGSEGETGAGAAAAERLPGMGAMYQQPDLSWRPLTLGLDDDWPPARARTHRRPLRVPTRGTAQPTTSIGHHRPRTATRGVCERPANALHVRAARAPRDPGADPSRSGLGPVAGHADRDRGDRPFPLGGRRDDRDPGLHGRCGGGSS